MHKFWLALAFVLSSTAAAGADVPIQTQSGTVGGLNAAVTVGPLYGQGTCAILTGAGLVGTRTFEGSADGVAFFAVNSTTPTGSSSSTTTVAGLFQMNVSGFQAVRVRVSAYTSGSATDQITCTGGTAPVAGRVDNGGRASITILSSSGTEPNVSSNPGDASASSNNLWVTNFGMCFNGATFDRCRKDTYAAGPMWTSTGGSFTAAIPAATALQVVKASAGRLVQLLVTTAGTASATCYDNASAGSGTILAITPATTTLGQTFIVNNPAASGITCTGGAGSPALTASYF